MKQLITALLIVSTLFAGAQGSTQINQLTPTTNKSNTTVFPVQLSNGTTLKMSLGNIRALFGGSGLLEYDSTTGVFSLPITLNPDLFVKKDSLGIKVFPTGNISLRPQGSSDDGAPLQLPEYMSTPFPPNTVLITDSAGYIYYVEKTTDTTVKRPVFYWSNTRNKFVLDSLTSGSSAVTIDTTNKFIWNNGTAVQTAAINVSGNVRGANITTEGNVTAGRLITNGNVTVSGKIAYGSSFNSTLTATAANDTLIGLDFNNTYVPGAFSGVSQTAFRTRGNGQVGWSSGDAQLAINNLPTRANVALSVRGRSSVAASGAAFEVLSPTNTTSFSVTGQSNMIMGTFNLNGSVSNSTAAQLRYTPSNTTIGELGLQIHPNANITKTGGSMSILSVGTFGTTGSFSPTSGSATLSALDINPTFNQTGTATGQVWGIRYRPTITALIGKHIAFQTDAGYWIMKNSPTYADDAAATAAGLEEGTIYKTATGQLMIKLGAQ